MKIKVRMEGAVNGHNFVIEGEGKGNPLEGVQTVNLTVKEGAPLPFAFDILTPAFCYGNKVFTKYPPDIVDYFKKSLPEGFLWSRSLTFEDHAVCTMTSTIRVEGDTIFDEKIHFHGVNFLQNSPVMQKKTLKWEPTTEKLYECNGVLKGNTMTALLLEGGGHHRCDFNTTYIAMKDVLPFPDYHFVDNRLEIVKHDKDYTKVQLHEQGVARYSLLPNKAM